MRSGRTSSPKIASGSVTDPDSLPSRVVTFSSMSRALLLRFGSRRRFSLRGGRRLGGRRLDLAGLRRLLRQRFLRRIAHGDPAALVPRHRALEHDQAAVDVGLHNPEVERGDTVDPQMARHLLVLEPPAGVLTAAGAADRAMRNRHTV